MSQLTLKCEKFGLSRGLHDLLSSGDLVDVTLACQGQFIQAHKAVLAACSPHFRDIFKLQPWQHPIVFMHDLDVTQLQALVDFMYNGEVTVNEADLPGFLKLADALKVSGLTPQDKENETRLNITVPDEVMIHLPPSPPAPPRPAKIARRTLDRDVSQRDPSPALIPVASSKVESSTTHSWADNVVSNLTSDIKLEVEELPDLSELQHDPISTQEFETAEEEKQGEDEDQDVETIQEDDSWYKAGPSTSQQSSCMPSTESQAGGQQPVAISSRGRRLHPPSRLQDEAPSSHLTSAHQTTYDLQRLRRYQCDHCKRHYKTKQSLDQHLFLKHPQIDTYACNTCNIQFLTHSELHAHKLHQHNLRGKRITQTTNLKHHGNHFVQVVKNGKRRRCAGVYCKSHVRTECEKCNVGLCIPCFKNYHTAE